jgi:hypothetical protein
MLAVLFFTASLQYCTVGGFRERNASPGKEAAAGALMSLRGIYRRFAVRRYSCAKV